MIYYWIIYFNKNFTTPFFNSLQANSSDKDRTIWISPAEQLERVPYCVFERTCYLHDIYCINFQLHVRYTIQQNLDRCKRTTDNAVCFQFQCFKEEQNFALCSCQIQSIPFGLRHLFQTNVRLSFGVRMWLNVGLEPKEYLMFV